MFIYFNTIFQMNNKLRIAIKVIISILIWFGVVYVAYTESVLPQPPCSCSYGPDVECYCASELELKGLLGENPKLGILLYFVLVPGILIFLFNKFFLKKKAVKK